MLVESELQDGVLVVNLHECRLEAAISSEFHQYVVEKIADNTNHVVLNLDSVEFIDSSGLGSVVAIKKAIDSNASVRICCSNRDVLNLFRLTRMDKFFDIYETLPAALAA